MGAKAFPCAYYIKNSAGGGFFGDNLTQIGQPGHLDHDDAVPLGTGLAAGSFIIPLPPPGVLSAAWAGEPKSADGSEPGVPPQIKPGCPDYSGLKPDSSAAVKVSISLGSPRTYSVHRNIHELMKIGGGTIDNY